MSFLSSGAYVAGYAYVSLSTASSCRCYAELRRHQSQTRDSRVVAIGHAPKEQLLSSVFEFTLPKPVDHSKPPSANTLRLVVLSAPVALFLH